MVVVLCALAGCKTRGEEIKERVDKALTGVTSDEQAIAAATRALWPQDNYDYQIKVLPSQGGGYQVDIVATRTSSTTALASAASLKDFELRQHARRLWRLFRTVGERQLRAVFITIRLPVGGPSGKDVMDFLRFRCNDTLVRGIPGYAEAQPFETQGQYDDPKPDGNRYLQRLAARLVIDLDNSAEIVIDQK